MSKAYLMKLLPQENEIGDRLGGLPSHSAGDVRDASGQPLAFIAQFYHHPTRLPLGEGVLCIQLYQRFPVDDPQPTIVVVPVGADENVHAHGRTNPRITPTKIVWEDVEEPTQLPDSALWDSAHLVAARSKAGGCTVNADGVPEGYSFVLQLREEPVGLNFGGYTIVVSRGPDGHFAAQLA